MKSADRWLSMHLETLGNILVFVNVMMILLLPVRQPALLSVVVRQMNF